MQGIQIGEILIEQGVLTEPQVRHILQVQKVSNRPFGDLAERLFGVDPRAVEDAWVEQYLRVTGVVDLEENAIDTECLRVLNRRQAWQFHLLPLHRDEQSLSMATSAEDLVRSVNFATRTIQEPVHFLIAERAQLRDFLMRYYPVPQFLAQYADRLQAKHATSRPFGAKMRLMADRSPEFKKSKIEKGSSRIFKRLLLLLRPQWGLLAVGLILTVVSTPFDLFPALAWKYVTDDLLTRHLPTPVLSTLFSLRGAIHGSYSLLLSVMIWMFVVNVFGEAMGTASTNIMNRIAQKFILFFRNRVYHKLQSQSLGYLQRQRTGDLMSRAMGDVDELQSFIVSGIDVIIGEGAIWIATVVLVMLMDWRVATISLLPMIAVYFLLRYFNARIKSIYVAARERLGDVSTRLQENLSGVVVIKIFGREKQEAERFQSATENYYREQIRAINARSKFFPGIRILGFQSNILMLGVGAFLILRNPHPLESGFTIGSLMAFRAYWYRLYGPVQTLARVNDMIQRASAAGKRVFEVLDAPDELPDAPDAKPLETIDGRMKLDNVGFRYPLETAGKPQPLVLADVTIDIKPGQTVALCGPSGSGKSTVLNLLLRFYDPTTGQVTLDGIDLRSIQRTSLRSHFALVQQETFLFNDSIIDNIRYGHAEATVEQVINAARAANAHDFITRLPNGYDTKVGERGVRLSGGQKQRISIARAFVANPTVLLLDEPTSSVEPDSEATIIAALDRLMTGRTTVLTSHRPSLINQADVVYVIEDGKVTEHGPREELLRNDGWFSRFMRSAEEAMPATELESTSK